MIFRKIVILKNAGFSKFSPAGCGIKARGCDAPERSTGFFGKGSRRNRRAVKQFVELFSSKICKGEEEEKKFTININLLFYLFISIEHITRSASTNLFCVY